MSSCPRRRAWPTQVRRRAREHPGRAPWSPGFPTPSGVMVVRNMNEHARGLRDRLREGEELDGLLNKARNGQSGVLVVRGEAGIGKSALVASFAERADGFRVTEIAGVESEME